MAPPSKRLRLDQALLQNGLVPSRERAQGLILAGLVSVDGTRVIKPGTAVRPDARIEVAQDPNPYVSRGGLKLQAALDAFALNPGGLVAVDVGASTGGFTDCLLHRGATKVYAIDVGYGQLAWSLRQDPRVIVRERVNARHLDASVVPELCDLAVLDVSFISLDKVLPAVLPLLKPASDVVALVKPQFEAEPGEVGSGGVVRDDRVRQAVIARAIQRLTSLGLTVMGQLDSPVHGPAGNIECLVWLKRQVT